MDFGYGEKSYLQRLSDDADETEITALELGSATIDSGIDDDRIAGVMDDFSSSEDEPFWVARDIANESAASGVYNELLRRAEILGHAYPFELSNNTITPKENQNLLTYVFCLATSYQTNITSGPFTELPRTFELLAKEYCQSHLGAFAESLHTGWPRLQGAPTSFLALSKYIHTQTDEWFWQPDAGLTNDDSNHIKDCGIDFISWIQSPDLRPGKLYVLGQCACGKDWKSKYGDVELAKLDMWFNPVSWVTPVKAFCTPYALVDGYLYDASRRAGLVYDRFRLSKLAQYSEPALPQNIIDSMRRCIDLVLNDI